MNGLSTSELKTLSVPHLLMPKDFKPKKSSPRFYSSPLPSALATGSSRMDHSRMSPQENCKKLVHLELFWVQTALLSWSERAYTKSILVWTPCLMHRCVCIWWYILQNYNYKLCFQNLFIYNIPHISIGTLAAENLDVCPWDSNIQLTMGIDQRWQIYLNIFQLVSK